jgi:hypothetical protein
MTTPRIRYARLGGPTDKEVAAAKAVLAERDQAAAARKASARVQCAQHGLSPRSPIAKPCGKWFPIADAVYVDMQNWREAYGCTGGAYWYSGEGCFVCPHCGYLNRTYRREEVQKLSGFFASAVVAYEEWGRPLRFADNEEYPYPAHVKARLDADEAEREAQRLTAQAERLRAQVRAA